MDTCFRLQMRNQKFITCYGAFRALYYANCYGGGGKITAWGQQKYYNNLTIRKPEDDEVDSDEDEDLEEDEFDFRFVEGWGPGVFRKGTIPPPPQNYMKLYEV